MGISALTPVAPVPTVYSTPPNDVSLIAAAMGASTLAAPGDHIHKYTMPDTGWLVPTLQNGWVQYDTTYGNAAIYRRINGIVFVRGLLRSGTVGATIFTLPAGFRPSIRMLFACYTNPNVACRVDVDPTGTINGSGESNGWISLANIIFVADA